MRHITRCVNPKLSKICMQAIKLEELSQLLLNYLPDNLKDICKVGGLNQGCLILVVEDSVWASQLRYVIPELRDKLRSEAKLYHLSSIKIVIDRELFIKDSITPVTKTPKPKKTSPWQDILNFLSKS
jgi:hypothetical protein